MSKIAKNRALKHPQRRYPISKKPRTLEELLSEWMKNFNKSWKLGSTVPVDWSLVGQRSLEHIQVTRFSNDTLDIFPDWITLSKIVDKFSRKNLSSRKFFERRELKLLTKLLNKIPARISSVENASPRMSDSEIFLHSGEAVLWAFVLMRHRQLSNKFQVHYNHLIYTQIQTKFPSWRLLTSDWEKVVLLASSGHGDECSQCLDQATFLLTGHYENSKLVEKFGSNEAKNILEERRLDQDLRLVWQRYANNNSYGTSFGIAQFDGEYLERPISKFLDKRIWQGFNRDMIPNHDSEGWIHAEDILNGLDSQHLLATANALAFSTSIPYEEDEETGNPTTVAYSLQPVDKSKITWYGNKHRIEIAEKFMGTPLEQFTSFTFQALREINDYEFQSMLIRERDIFLDSVELYREGKMMRFAKEAFPATENLVRIFTAMIGQDNPDGWINAEAVIEKKTKNDELVPNKSGMFKDLGDLFNQLKGNKYQSIDQRFRKKKISETWTQPLSLIEFFMTSNSAIGYGLNLRNEVAHGLIRRELTTDEGFAFMLSWLLGFELIWLASTERKKRREFIQKEKAHESWLCDSSFASGIRENSGSQWLDPEKSEFAKIFWRLVDGYHDGARTSVGPLRPERAVQALRTIFLDEEICIRWPEIWKDSREFRDLLESLRQYEKLIGESSQRLSKYSVDEIKKFEEISRRIRKRWI